MTLIVAFLRYNKKKYAKRKGKFFIKNWWEIFNRKKSKTPRKLEEKKKEVNKKMKSASLLFFHLNTFFYWIVVFLWIMVLLVYIDFSVWKAFVNIGLTKMSSEQICLCYIIWQWILQAWINFHSKHISIFDKCLSSLFLMNLLIINVLLILLLCTKFRKLC